MEIQLLFSGPLLTQKLISLLYSEPNKESKVAIFKQYPNKEPFSRRTDFKKKLALAVWA